MPRPELVLRVHGLHTVQHVQGAIDLLQARVFKRLPDRALLDVHQCPQLDRIPLFGRLRRRLHECLLTRFLLLVLLPHLFVLKAGHELNNPLRVCGRPENLPGVFLQRLDPRPDVRHVLARIVADFQPLAQQIGCDFGAQFLARVSLRSEWI